MIVINGDTEEEEDDSDNTTSASLNVIRQIKMDIDRINLQLKQVQREKHELTKQELDDEIEICDYDMITVKTTTVWEYLEDTMEYLKLNKNELQYILRKSVKKPEDYEFEKYDIEEIWNETKMYAPVVQKLEDRKRLENIGTGKPKPMQIATIQLEIEVPNGRTIFDPGIQKLEKILVQRSSVW